MYTVFKVGFALLTSLLFGSILVARLREKNVKHLPLLASGIAVLCFAGILILNIFLSDKVLDTREDDIGPVPGHYQWNPDPTPKAEHPGPITEGDPSIALVALTNAVKPGKKASITVKAEPHKLYLIEVHYGDTVSKAKGLEPTVSDESGQITWSWTVSVKTEPGVHSITVSDGHVSNTFYFTVENAS